MRETDQALLEKLYPSRPDEVHKYEYGLVLCVGGSESYSGAPALAGLGAFRAGADMVRVIAPVRAANIIASFSPILATVGLEGEYLTKKHLSILLARTRAGMEVSHGNYAVVIGSGLGRTKETQDAIFEYLQQTEARVVIDADALHVVAKNSKIVEGKPFVLTPNLYEFFLLCGKDLKQASTEERTQVVLETAAAMNTTIILKGATDIVSDGKDVMLNKTGSPYMSVGGTGDILAGIIAALIARNINPVEAAAGGAYLNGKAGELVGGRYKDALVATDIIDALHEIMP